MPLKLDDFETGSGKRASQRLLRERYQMAEFEGRMAVQVRRLDEHQPLRGQPFLTDKPQGADRIGKVFQHVTQGDQVKGSCRLPREQLHRSDYPLACRGGFRPVGHSGFHTITFTSELPAERLQQNSQRTAHIQMPPELQLIAANHCGQMPGPPLLNPAVLARVALLAVAAFPVFVLVVSIQCRLGGARRLEHQAAAPAEHVADHQSAHRM